MNVAQQIVQTLEDRGVQFAFSVPGEENISLVTELEKSDKIKLITCHDEQEATFMAAMVGWQSDQPGVTLSTLGPGALNMAVALADANSHSFPLLALSAQGPIESLNQETKQVVDLKAVYTPMTKFADYLYKPESTASLINKAYNEATNDRRGPAFIGIPSDFERVELEHQKTKITNPNPQILPTDEALNHAAEMIKQADKPLLVAGLGAARSNLEKALLKLVDKHNLPITTTYMAKGIVPESHPNSLGVSGFLVKDYVESAIEDYDLIIAVGFDFAELSPDRINPHADKQVINIHAYPQETHSHFSIDANLMGDMAESLSQLSEYLGAYKGPAVDNEVQEKLRAELDEGAKSAEDGPLSPVQIVHAASQVLSNQDRILVDTGALKMWMARLFPAEKLNQVMVNNAMSSMAWSIPGTIAAKLLNPNQKLLTMIGDGSFNMNSQSLALAKALDVPLTLVIWDDSGYELIKWKMEMQLNESAGVSFENPDFVKLAEAYGGRGHLAKNRDHLKQLMAESLEKQDGIDVIVAPVDYSDNLDLSDRLEDELS